MFEAATAINFVLIITFNGVNWYQNTSGQYCYTKLHSGIELLQLGLIDSGGCNWWMGEYIRLLLDGNWALQLVSVN